MSAYLQFFQLERSPFDTSAQSGVVLGTQALREAFAAIEKGLAEGSPRICVNGQAGLGKTSLARALPKLLAESARLVVLLNPSLSWRTLRTAIVRQLDLAGGTLSRTSLAAAASAGRRLVVVIDRAETISLESLEHLDILLHYRGDDDRQLVHCVMLANLEAGGAGEQECALLWWLDQLTTLQLEFAPIPAAGVASYIHKHLRRAGWKGGRLFSNEAALAVHRLTGGVPRKVSEMCDRVLAAAAERGSHAIDVALVEAVGSDTSPRAEAPPRPAPAIPAEPPPARLERPAAPSFVASGAHAHGEPAPPPRDGGARAFAPEKAPLSLDSFFGSSGPEVEDEPMGAETVLPNPGREAPDGPRWGLWAAAVVGLVALAAAGFNLLPSAEATSPPRARSTPFTPGPPAAEPTRVLARPKQPAAPAPAIEPAAEAPLDVASATRTAEAGLDAAETPAVPPPSEPAPLALSELRPEPSRPAEGAQPPATPAPSPAEAALNERYW